MRNPRGLSVLLLGLGVGLATAVDAAVIYRWVDKQGRTHFGDTVPSEYKDVARPVEPVVPSPASEEQRRAVERAAQAKVRAEAGATKPAPAASAPTASAPAATKRPPFAPTEDTDCETWRRLYRESLECFAPYRTAHGVKAEAFEHCTPVPAPPTRCGRHAK